MENLPSIATSQPEAITAVGIDNLPSNKKPKKTLWLAILGLFFVLASTGMALWLVGQRQQLRKEAEETAAPRPPVDPPPPLEIKSELDAGQWKQVGFDGYPGCSSSSASQCDIQPYSTADGWTSGNYTPDSNWKTGFVVEEPQSSWWYDFGWECSKIGVLAETKIVGPVEGKIKDGDRIFSNINAVTGLYRREFTVPEAARNTIEKINFDIFSDNKVIVYLNGQIVYRNQEKCASLNIDPQSLQNGKNVLAIQLSNDKVSSANNPLGLAYKLKIEFGYISPLACSGLNIKNSAGQEVTEIALGETVTVASSGLSEKGGVWYAQIPADKTRCTEGDCQLLTSIAAGSVSQSFKPTQPGKYVFETNVFNNECTALCSAGHRSYENAKPGDCETGQWQNGVDCDDPNNSNNPRCISCQNGVQKPVPCLKYLTVKEATPLACAGLNIKNSAGQEVTEIALGETVTVASSGLSEKGGVWYAQIPADKTRCTEGDCQLLTSIAAGSVSQSFKPTQPGKYVFETNVFDNQCQQLCSPGQQLYENGKPGNCEAGQWQNGVDCRPDKSNDPRCSSCQNGDQCKKYLIVLAEEPALACLSLTKDISQPKYGDRVALICQGSPLEKINHFNFRWQVGNNGPFNYVCGAHPSRNDPTIGTIGIPPIEEYGRWHAQCQVCSTNASAVLCGQQEVNSGCTAWGEAQ